MDAFFLLKVGAHNSELDGFVNELYRIKKDGKTILIYTCALEALVKLFCLD